VTGKWTEQVKMAMQRDGTPVTATDFDKYVAHRRKRNQALPNPFIQIANMSATERHLRGERVLWEDADAMVLVDKFQDPGPKVLVIPKAAGIWFPPDAPEAIMRKLERVAAAASDAFMSASGRGCDPSATSEIYVHDPDSLGVQQLHLHVLPRWRLAPSENPNTYYDRVARELSRTLR
jgi:diadenosine tetraphosphate (Ap4A) HIT family hydrolase